MDPKLLPTQPSTIHVLDLTENNFTGAVDLRFLFEFTNLHTLILDKNQIQSNFTIPPMEQLTTLWVNHNRIENLAVFIENLQKHCPSLVYLSMMNNKAAPSYFNGGSLVEYNDYKMYVISKLTKLQMIDHKEITAEERLQSQAIYGQGRLARYNDFSVEDQLRRRRSTLKQRKFSSSTLESKT
jgi:Leucine-rich repeat (LRR) protein